SGRQEQGLQVDRRHGRRFKNGKRGARIHAPLVDAHPPCRPPRSREVSRDGAVPLQRNLGCNRRRSLCRKRLQTSACPRLGEGLQDHRQPHPIQPSFLTAFAYSSLFAASSFKPGPDRAFFHYARGESRPSIIRFSFVSEIMLPLPYADSFEPKQQITCLVKRSEL